VQLTVYNLLREKIAVLVSEKQKARYYSASFDASQLPSGIYFHRLKRGSFVQTRKMVLLR